MDFGLFKLEVSNSLQGDRLILDPKILEVLEDELSSDRPLIIEIIAADGTSSFGIGWEFTAQQGIFKLSQEKAGQLNCPTEPYKLRHVVLEKGTFAQLTFMSNIEYNHDFRALLEATIRQKYATLVKNETISLEIEKEKSRQEIKFLVSNLKPKDVVLTINTDIEVDIVSPVGVGLDRVKSQNSRVQLNWTSDTVELTNAKIENSLYFEGKIDNSKPYINIVIRPKDGDIDVFASTIYEYPDLMHHDFFNADYGNSVLDFKIENISQKYLYIGLTANTEKAHLEFDLTITRSDQPFQVEAMESKATGPKEGSKPCDNCKAWIPIATLNMHTAFCLRNNILCPNCLLVFKKSEFNNHWHCEMMDCNYVGHVRGKEKHHKTVHIPKSCDCGSFYFLNDIANHRRTDCPERKIICGFCHLFVRAGPRSNLAKDIYLGTGLSEHESVCGSRTITCVMCQKQVQLKEIQIHAKLHSFTEKVTALPKICYNVNCSNTLQSTSLLNLCESCSEPLSDHSIIPQKLIQTYHLQLTKGCEQTFCRNEKCYSGLKNTLDLVNQMNPTDAAVEAIRLFKESQGSIGKFYLCVKNAMVHRRRILANELVNMGYNLDLSIKGLQENNDDLNETISWLLSSHLG